MMLILDDGGTVVKAAETADERIRLRREAEVLRRVAHAGIVRLLGAEGETPEGTDRLILARVPGDTLAARGPQGAAAAASWAADVATTVADLHDVGWVHGNLRAEHVIFDESDRAVLCGFSRAERVAWGQGGGTDRRIVDEDTLIQLIADHVAGSDTGVHRAVARWDRRRRRGGLRALARDLSAEARSPAVESASRHHLNRRTVLIGSGTCLSVVLMSLLVLSGTTSRTKDSHVGSPSASTEVAVPAYLLRSDGTNAPISAIGRWGCGPARPAVVVPATGQVWLFAGVPGPSGHTSARLIGDVPGAIGLSAERSPSGCDQLTVLRDSGPGLPMIVTAGG